MLTPDRLGPIENAIRNIAFLLMAGMMQAMSSLMGDLSQTLHDAFGGDQKRDVAAEVREHMTGDQSKMLEEMIAEAKPDTAMQTRLVSKLDDETADHLLQVITAEDYGLPPLTEALDPPALLAYYQLLQEEREPLTSAVQEFAGTLQALTQPQNRLELQQDMEGRLSSMIGEPVKVEIDKSCGEELGAAPQLDAVVSAYQQLAWTDWKKRELAKVDVVRVKNVKSVEKVAHRRNGAALELDACVAEGDVGIVSGDVLSAALDEEMMKSAQEALIAARAKRSIAGLDGIQLEISGLRVIQPTATTEQDLRPFSVESGTTIAITLRRADGGLTAFTSEQSVLRSAVDDQGKDLFIADDPASSSSAEFGSFPTLNAEGTACLLEVELPGVPTSGARHIALDLDLAFEIATGVNELTTPVTWKTGGHFKVGTLPFEVTSYEADDYGTRVDLKTNKSLDDLAGFRFISSGGEELPVSITSSSRMGMDDDLTEERQLSFEGAVQKGKLIVRMWKGKRVVIVPVKVEVGVGF